MKPLQASVLQKKIERLFNSATHFDRIYSHFDLPKRHGIGYIHSFEANVKAEKGDEYYSAILHFRYGTHAIGKPDPEIRQRLSIGTAEEVYAEAIAFFIMLSGQVSTDSSNFIYTMLEDYFKGKHGLKKDAQAYEKVKYLFYGNENPQLTTKKLTNILVENMQHSTRLTRADGSRKIEGDALFNQTFYFVKELIYQGLLLMGRSPHRGRLVGDELFQEAEPTILRDQDPRRVFYSKSLLSFYSRCAEYIYKMFLINFGKDFHIDLEFDGFSSFFTVVFKLKKSGFLATRLVRGEINRSYLAKRMERMISILTNSSKVVSEAAIIIPASISGSISSYNTSSETVNYQMGKDYSPLYVDFQSIAISTDHTLFNGDDEMKVLQELASSQKSHKKQRFTSTSVSSFYSDKVKDPDEARRGK